MTTLAELRALVRTQTQTDVADLPDSTVDSYLQQGFERTIAAENQWPFYATTWSLTLDPNQNTLTLPGDVNPPGIISLIDGTSGLRLGMVPQIWAETAFAGVFTGTAGPAMFSPWGDQINLWPAITFSEPRTYTLRGYRKPLVWISPVTGAPDCDPRLHLPLTHFAVALAYAQQEDDVLEALYLARWQADVELARQAIMEPVHSRPLIMGGSAGRYRGPEFVPTGYVVETPAPP